MSHKKIIPAIIPSSKEDLEESLRSLSFAQIIQVDVVDGKFVPYVSWPYEPKGNPQELSHLFKDRLIEVDLMVEDQLAAARDWINAGARRLIFHLEGLTDTDAVMALKDEFEIELGLALENDTPLDVLYPYLDRTDFVQLMGIAEIGKQGQPFDERIIERLRTLRGLYPEIILAVDGAVSLSTIPSLLEAGVDRLISGSSILKADDPKAMYEKMSEMLA